MERISVKWYNMKNIICILKHNWLYENGLKNLSYKVIGIEVNIPPVPIIIRSCKRCGKKQESSIGYGIYNFKLKNYVNWHTVETTIEDKRDFKISKILK